MHLTDVLRREMVWPDLTSTTKQEILGELARHLAAHLNTVEEAQIFQILTEREGLGSTGIQDGIAIPHGRVPGLSHIVVACGRSLPGVAFDSHDAKPTHLFFVLLAPEFAAGQHLKALARLSRLLKDAAFRHRLMEATTTEEMYQTIVQEDAKI